jgi:hypothetical protein
MCRVIRVREFQDCDVRASHNRIPLCVFAAVTGVRPSGETASFLACAWAPAKTSLPANVVACSTSRSAASTPLAAESCRGASAIRPRLAWWASCA